jgi:hypothetical protein
MSSGITALEQQLGYTSEALEQPLAIYGMRD